MVQSIMQDLDLNEKIFIEEVTFEGKKLLHTNNFVELVYFLSGTGMHKIGNHIQNLTRGHLLFIYSQQDCEIVCNNEMRYVNILIDPSFITEQLIDSENAIEMLILSIYEEFQIDEERMIPKINFEGRDILIVEDIIVNMLREFNEKRSAYRMAIESYLQLLFVKIFQCMHNEEINKNTWKSIGKNAPELLQYLDDKCFEKLSVTELAKKSFYNPSYFSRAFKEYFGITITEYIRKRRIEEAVHLLKNTDLSVEEIALSVGYNDKKQFYKNFNVITGALPKDFRGG